MSGAVDLGIEGLADVELVDSGGTGRVYVARQVEFDRRVAVKVINAENTGDVKRRFERERAAMGRLSTVSGIVPVYGGGETHQGEPYLLMRFIAGGSLADRLDAEGPMPWRAAVETIVEVAGALAAAHENEVLHRDIKPANILVDGDGTPLIADFGLAKLALGNHTFTSSNLMGTPAYCPPEVFGAADPTVAADVYSLGATLWALIAGHAPFTSPGGSDSLNVLMARVLSKPPGDLRSRAPGGVCEAIERAMAKDPEDRFASVGSFASALKSSLGESRTFEPDPTVEVTGWTEPHEIRDGRLYWAAGAGVAAALVGAVLLFTGGGNDELHVDQFSDAVPCTGESVQYATLRNATPNGAVVFTVDPPLPRLDEGQVNPDGTLDLIWDCDADEIGTVWQFTATDVETGGVVAYELRGDEPV